MKGISFDEFHYLIESNKLLGEAKWHTSKQIVHLTDSNGEILVDIIGRFKNLQEDFDKICEVLDIQSTSLLQLNVLKSETDYMSYYNSKLKKLSKIFIGKI
jgi:hypothetical protein